MITATALTAAGRLDSLSFKFESGVLCLVTNRPETEKAFFSLILSQSVPDSGEVVTECNGISLCASALPPEMKVKDYIRFVRRCRKTEDIPELSLSLTGSLSERCIRGLSALERLYVSAAASLIGSPELVLMRAPSDGLEITEMHRLGVLIDRMREYADIIFSCDVPSVFMEYSDKLLVIANTKVICYGDTAEVISKMHEKGSLVTRIKGDMDVASGFLDQSTYKLEPTEKPGIFTVRCTEEENTRKEIRQVVRKLGMAILEMKADGDALRDMFGALSRAEADMTERSENVEDVVFTPEMVAFNRNEDDSMAEDGDTEAHESEEKNDSSRRSSITVSFAHNDDDEE